jgi:hypothetical protein
MAIMERGLASHDLRSWSTAADVVAKSLFYAAVARASGARVRNALVLGAVAGVTATLLPKAIGLSGMSGRLVGMATSAAALTLAKLPQRLPAAA